MKNRFELLCRSGYAARGVVYILLGSIALASALFGGNGEASSNGAFSTILEQPFGRVLLALVAVGLFGHVLWRLAEAFLNADDHDDDAKGYLARAGNLAGAIANTGLVIGAASLAWAGGGGAERGAAAWLIEQPLGRWLLGVGGLVVVAAGLIQIWRGVSAKYQERVKLPSQHRGVLTAICSFGLTARGLVIVVTGGFLIYAAFSVDPRQAGGTAEALDWVRRLPLGWLIYGLAALGLVAFGVYSMIEARYRELAAPDTTALRHAATRPLKGLRP